MAALIGRVLCRLDRHKLYVTAADIAGHQSRRWARCERCRVEFTQRRKYFGGAAGPWELDEGQR